MGKVEEARTHIKKASEINSNGIAGTEGLNNFVYNLLSAGSVDLGLNLLKIAVELYPHVANLYDSIGEFYLEKDMIEDSIAWYKKPLEVDPDFENAKRMLKQIMAEMETRGRRTDNGNRSTETGKRTRGQWRLEDEAGRRFTPCSRFILVGA